MSLKKVHHNQPNDFKFTEENQNKMSEILKNIQMKTKKVPLCLYFILLKDKMIIGFHYQR